MDVFAQELEAFQAAQAHQRCALDWLNDFEAALSAGDAKQIASLFHEDSHWRDVLAFTWHMTPVAGRDQIAARLVAEQKRVGAHSFQLPRDRKAPRKAMRVGIECIEAIFEFTTSIGKGAGIFRLSPDLTDGGKLKAWLISTTLQSITGHEE